MSTAHQHRIPLVVALLASPLMIVGHQATNTALAQETAKVIKWVAPSTYPAIARQAKASGKVLVEVEINGEGKVVYAHVIAGHALLKAVAVSAARKWEFSAVDNAENPKATLTFDFQMVDKKKDEAIVFKPPYELYISKAPDEISFEKQ